MESWKEVQTQKKALNSIKELALRYQADSDIQKLYEEALQNLNLSSSSFTFEKEQAVINLEKSVAERPLIFIGRVEDIRVINDEYVLALRQASLISLFDGAFKCNSNVVDHMLSSRRSDSESFALVVLVNRIQKPLEQDPDALTRFQLHGECIDIINCGEYWVDNDGDFSALHTFLTETVPVSCILILISFFAATLVIFFSKIRQNSKVLPQN